MRRCDTSDVQQHPQRLSCPLSAPGTRLGCVLPRCGLGQKRLAGPYQARPWPPGGHGGAHRPPPWPRGRTPPAQARQARFPTRCPAFGRADERGPAALPEAFPGLRATLARPAQEARPHGAAPPRPGSGGRGADSRPRPEGPGPTAPAEDRAGATTSRRCRTPQRGAPPRPGPSEGGSAPPSPTPPWSGAPLA